MGSIASRRRKAPPLVALVMSWVPALALAASAVLAAPAGRLQGRIRAADTGDPLAFADVALIPADTTARRVGSLTNADGTFLLEAAPGRYTLQIRALSYATQRIEGIVLEADRLLPFETALQADAIRQEEIVVEGKAIQGTEASLLAARRRASTVGDAVGAEQVRRSPDRDAAEVLRRVTGLSVSDGKYVFVRGLGERYSSVELDGVRIASPEENKRVVPLDLVPAHLIENIVVQKTHSADRPGEFGGGDVQVHTKDFPGRRTWSFSASQGVVSGVTFADRLTYAGTPADVFGFGADARRLPGDVQAATRDTELGEGFSPLRRDLAKAFRPVWSPTRQRAFPNSGFSATYGDELRLFGRPLGLIESWSFSRTFDREQREVVELRSSLDNALFRLSEDRHVASAQLGGITGLSYRLSPRHTLHLRGLYMNSAEDEVRTYVGPFYDNTDLSGQPLHRRSTRLLYVQRSVRSGTVDGRHTIAGLLGSTLDWKLTRSRAERRQPDRREVLYSRNYYDDGSGNLVEYWALGSTGLREYGELGEDGWGATLSATVPYRLGGLGNGKVILGWDRQTKERSSSYRRFSMVTGRSGLDLLLPPDSLFDFSTGMDTLGYVSETTLDVDNYDADQRVTAAFVSADVPLGRRVRANLGVRVEDGTQDVRTHAYGAKETILERGELDDRDWLPSGNLTWSATDAVNLRMAASRTVSRPDLNELSPSPALEYYAGFRVAGNSALQRARIDNYDLRVETFPGPSEVLAAGLFYKALHQPIERTITGASAPLLVPFNSAGGRNVGVELESRAGLGRLWRRLKGLSLNANASFISSRITLKPTPSRLGSTEHPLQGQADHLVNVALVYTSRGAGVDAAVMLSAAGRRLRTLAYDPLPDIYDEPVTTLDATVNLAPLPGTRLKLGAKNLLDPRIRALQGGREVLVHRAGRSFSVAVSVGS